MKRILRSLLQSILPAKQWMRIQAARSRNHQVRWLKRHKVLDMSRRFAEVNGSAVLHGPFRGMCYPAASIESRHSVPMLLGSYERELHGIIESALEHQYAAMIDIGTAEGYYAVGFALKGRSPVVTFEADTRELDLCRQMARLNQVEDRISMQDWCSSESLCELAQRGPCFVLSDCEGYETALFDRPAVEALRASDVLIEIHDGTLEPLVGRFATTHEIELITARDRSPSEYAELKCLGPDAARAVTEYRAPRQQWLFARAR